MAKQLNVNLAFTADTTQAKQQLQQLQTTLNSLAAGQGIQTSMSGMTTSIQQGVAAAAELKVRLQEATNVNTGKLDLGKFNQQLKQSGMNLQQYAKQLSNLGPQGVQAFNQLAGAISNAEVPIVRVSGKLAALGVTLKNTLKWQISSMALHGLISGVSTAFNYAQDLNKSLNSIAIVTNKSADEMARLGKEANKTAQALNTSTVAYTDAALIYYQQGLNDRAVKERTEATVKLANVTRESADTVSQWMTAIWNNFDDGSKRLEYYADVITALGAATASSSDEIAQGLEKFAAIAETVGLSYEYATSALATVTAQTRQSADVVGTAFKTLFARIEGLQLGETQEDGTTLNRYSEALFKVGVNIKNDNYELKTMDQILDEIGAKWKTLGKDQQVALAQAVGGIRQYNQMIALMDNWDYFQENLLVAKGSEGTLQEQADIYAESWEGASKRVKAAAEDLYDDLINDEFFINLTDGIAKLLQFIDKLIGAMGGLPGLLTLISAGMLHFMGPQIAHGLENVVLNLKSLTQWGRKAAESLKEEAWSIAGKMQYGDASAAGAIRADNFQREAEFQQLLLQKAKSLSEVEIKIYQTRMDGIRTMGIALEKQAEALDLANKQLQIEQDTLALSATKTDYKQTDKGFQQLNKDATSLVDMEDRALLWENGKIHTKTQADLMLTQNAQSILRQEGVFASQDKIQQYFSGTLSLSDEGIGAAGISQEALAALETSKKAFQGIAKESARANVHTGKMGKAISEATKGAVAFTKTKMSGHIKTMAKETGISIEKLAKYSAQKKQVIRQEKEHAQSGKKLEKTMQGLTDTIKKGTSLKGFTTDLVATMKGVSSLAMGLSSLSSAFSTIGNVVKKQELTFSDFTSILMSLSMGIPMIIGGLSALAGVMGLTELATYANLAATEKYTAAQWKELAVKSLGITADKAQILWDAIREKGIKNLTAAELMNIAAENGITISKGAATFATIAQTVANWQLLASMPPLLAIMLILTAAIVALAATVAIVVGLFKAWKNSTPEEQLKKAKENAKALGDELQRVNDQASKLKDTLNSYDEAVNKLKECTRGTQEWNQALVEANNQALELLTTYPELATMVNAAGEKAITTDANGLMVVADWAQNYLENRMNDKVMIAQMAKTMADQSTREAEIRLQKKNLRKEILPDQSLERDVQFATTLGLTPLLGRASALAATAATIGSIAREVQEESAQEKIENNIENLINKTPEEIEAALKDLKLLGYDDKDLQELTDRLVESGDELAAAIATDAAARKQEFKNLATSIIMANDGYNKILQYNSNSNLQNALLNSAGLKLEALTDQFSNEYKDSDFKSWFFGPVRTKLGENLVKQYAELMGYDDLNIKNFKDQKVKVDIVKEDGGDVESVEWSYQQIITALASEKATNELDAQTDELIHNLQVLSATAEEAGSALVAFQADNINALTEAQAKALGSKEGGQWFLDKNKVDETLRAASQSLGMDVDTFITETLGYESYEDYINKLADAFYKYDEVLAETIRLEQEQAEVNAKFEEVAESLETTTGALDNYTESLMANNNALSENKKAAADIAIAYAKFAQGMNALQEAFEDNYEILVEWNEGSLDTWEAVNALQQSLKDVLGVEVSSTFVSSHLEEIERLINGDSQALEELSQEAATDYIANLEGVADATKLQVTNILSQIQDLAAGQDLGIGVELEGEDEMITSLNQLLAEGKISAEQLQAAFNTIGFNPDIEYVKIETETENRADHFGPDGEPTGHTITKVKGSTIVPQIRGKEMRTTNINEGTSTFSDKAFNVSSGTGSGLTYMGSAEDKMKALDLGYDENKHNRSINSIDEELERYHEVNEVIEDLNRQYETLEREKDRAFGSYRLKLIDQEIAKTKELVSAQKQYIDEITTNLSIDKSALSKYGAAFDSEGRIANYDELYQVNYNALEYAKNNYGEEKFNEQQELFNKFKEEVAQYEETLNLLESEQETLSELMNQEINARIEKIEYAVEFKIELEEDAIGWLDHQLQNIEDDAFAAAEAIGYLTQKTAALMEQNKVYEQGIKDLLSESFTEAQIENILTDNLSALPENFNLTADQIDLLREYRDSLYDTNEVLREMRQETYAQVGEAFEYYNEEMSRSISNIEHYGSILESYKNIIDTVGKDALGVSDEAMSQMAQAQVSNTVNLMRANKEIYDANKKTVESLQEQLNKTTDPESRKLLEEQIHAAEEALMESSENFYSSWQDALAAAADAFSASVNTVAENFSKAVSGIYSSIDTMIEAFDRQKELNERYLQDYQKLYHINKLNRDINNSIDSTDNVKAQAQLRDLMSEINAYAADNKQMSQYDLEYLQKKYDLMVAEAAFKEAQNAKNQVRLQRDSEGNWGYVYVANQANSAKAEQNYEDKLLAMQDFMYQTEVELTDMYINSLSNYYSQVQELAELYGEDSAVFQEKVAMLRQRLEEDTGFTLGQLELFANRGLEINQRFGTDLTDTFQKSLLGPMYQRYHDWQSLLDGVNDQINISIDNVLEHYTTFGIELDEIMATADITVSDFSDEMISMAKTSKAKSQEAANDVKSMADKMVDAFTNPETGIISAINSWESQYGNKVTEIQAYNSLIAESINSLLIQYEALANAAAKDYTPQSNTTFQKSAIAPTATGSNGGIANRVVDGSTAQMASAGFDQWYGEKKDAQGVVYDLIGDSKENAHWVKRSDTRILTDKEGKAVGREQTGGKSYMQIDYNTKTLDKDGVTYYEKNGLYYSGDAIVGGKDKKVFGLYISNSGRTKGDVLGAKWKVGTVLDYNSSKNHITGYYLDDGEFISKKVYENAFKENRGNLKVKDIAWHDGEPIYLLGDRYWYKQSDLTAYAASVLKFNGEADDNVTLLDDDGSNKPTRDHHPISSRAKWIFGSDLKLDIAEVTSLDGKKYAKLGAGEIYPGKWIEVTKQMEMQSLDTGGYTGDWGDSSGRLAMLHRKEIILNATDTENFLSAINIVRSISDKIETLAAFTARGLGNLSASVPMTTGDSLEQNVTIRAEFPNVTNHNEIEQAFDNLINRASQYANRK